MTGVATITLDEAKERIRRLAEERPDFVYEKVLVHERDDEGEVVDTYGACRYFDQVGVPSCIIGHAFADELRRAGVDFDLTAGVSELAGLYGPVLGQHDPILPLETDALDFLTTVQRQQDRGIPWGQAYQQALDNLPPR